MNTSLFELFKIGIGPSSSHTVGPMRAAREFVNRLRADGLLEQTAQIRVELYGSLALTGRGHGTDRAILFGLSGESPANVAPESMERILREWMEQSEIVVNEKRIPFREGTHLIFHRDQMYPDPDNPVHPNGIRFTAFDPSSHLLAHEIIYSIGGGFTATAADYAQSQSTVRRLPYPFHSAASLLSIAASHELTFAELIYANECSLDETAEQGMTSKRVLHLWRTMRECAERGMNTEGNLPGGLNVRRRASRLAQRLRSNKDWDSLAPMDWVSVYAIAVNEENAAGGRVVTAPTNGAAGVIPAVGLYYLNFTRGDEDGILRYMLTAAAIGILYRENASISGAEVGCQGEVGVASSMAAGGLVAALGGNNLQVEHAAEIAMEHHLGMTCDPVGGLVQIPCIERNAMGAVKAVNAARLAMAETEQHKISLDQVIETMYRTGMDMQSRYKETSLAGLALNVIEC